MSTTLTRWEPIEGFPGYSISPEGRVRNDSTKHLLRPRYNQYGVPYVGLVRNWRQYVRSLPRLVAQTYLDTPNAIFDTPVNIDGDRSNCSADNLMWRPRWYAVRYLQQFKERYHNPINEPIKVRGEARRYRNSFEAAIEFGLLEREVVLSILNSTPAWPTNQRFELG